MIKEEFGIEVYNDLVANVDLETTSRLALTSIVHDRVLDKPRICDDYFEGLETSFDDNLNWHIQLNSQGSPISNVKP